MSAIRSIYRAKAAKRDLDVVRTSNVLMSGKHQKLLLTRVRSWVKAVDVQAIFGSMQTPMEFQAEVAIGMIMLLYCFASTDAVRRKSIGDL